MRGRRGHSPSSSSSSACFVSLLVNVSQEQTSMALRKQILKDAGDIPSGSQRIDLNTQEDEALDDNEELLSSSSSSSSSSSRSREKRKREKESKSKPNEMTEEEMMDLALRLSEQEASVTALRLQQEEEAMMKAIQESIVSQTQPCPPSQSPSPLNDAEASLRLCSRRKLLYSNRKFACAVSQGASEDVCTPETDLNRADESNDGSKKRKRKEGSPLLEMPDLSQTQKISCQASPCSSDCVSAPLDSPQSSDSTLIDECQLHKSPVFPSTGCRAEVHVPRLSQDLLQTCRTSGFVLCSQESLTSTLKSPPAQPKSPTFPKSLKYSNNFTLSRSPVFSETDRGDNGAGLTERSPEYFKSPVFGRNTQHETSASACKPKVSSSGFMFSSQESLTPSVRSTSCRSKSPVFPKSPGLSTNPPSPERSATCKSPVFPEADGGQTEQSRGCCTSPVIGRTGGRQKVDVDVQNHSESPSAAELRGSDGEGNPTTTRDPSQSLRQDRGTDHTASASDDAEELNEISKNGNSAETAPTSNMVLVWSEEDDDVTPVGSPSPVFPEEKPLHQADSEAASLNHVTAASPGVNCRPSTSSTSTGRLQLPTTEQEPRPISSQGTDSRASAPPRDPAGGPTVHYYWGVPFCPRGLDPDKYTQVIMAQMEVYEKSLKQAQRCLLRKAEWGEAVLPQLEKSPSPESRAESPQQLVPRRRGLRLKGKKLCEEADSCPAEEEDEKEDEEERVSKEEEEKKERGGEKGHVDTDDDCEVCPETQLSAIDDDRTQDLMLPTNTGAESDCKMSREQPEVEMILRVDSPSEAELQDDEEEMEVEADVDRKAKRSVPVISSDVGGQHVTKEDVEEIKDRGLQRSTSPELEAAAGPQSSDTKVDCPICQGSFPVTQIERHAAYCDGEVDDRRPEKDCFQVSLKPRKKRTRTAEASAEETNKPSNTGKNQEKCYICQKAVPLRDYSRHTELCIQRQASKTAAKGNLLSALQQTESRDSEAGPSGSKLQLGEVIDLRDDDDEDDDEEEGGSVSLLRISNSPIRSFTPISEATGCLIDFKKQHRAKKLRQRRR